VKIRTFPAVLLLAVLLLGCAAGVVISAEAPGICETALIACLSDPFNLPIFGVIYCLEGYAFCKKYIES
jgi:hypothetical protein